MLLLLLCHFQGKMASSTAVVSTRSLNRLRHAHNKNLRFDEEPPRMVIMVGLKGSGKSDFCIRLYGLGYTVIEIPNNCRRSLRTLLSSAVRALIDGKSIVINLPNLTVQDRKPWLTLAHARGCQYHFVFLAMPLEYCIDRVQRHVDQSDHPQLERIAVAIQHAQESFQPFTEEEERFCVTCKTPQDVERTKERFTIEGYYTRDSFRTSQCPTIYTDLSSCEYIFCPYFHSGYRLESSFTTSLQDNIRTYLTDWLSFLDFARQQGPTYLGNNQPVLQIVIDCLHEGDVIVFASFLRVLAETLKISQLNRRTDLDIVRNAFHWAHHATCQDRLIIIRHDFFLDQVLLMENILCDIFPPMSQFLQQRRG